MRKVLSGAIGAPLSVSAGEAMFAKEYDVYLQGFIPGDEPTETKLAAKLVRNSNYTPTSWADK
ncbi:MAG: hypothetical protein AAF378_16220 [Cyanobacteria bacterium P01_A01_bin.84]